MLFVSLSHLSCATNAPQESLTIDHGPWLVMSGFVRVKHHHTSTYFVGVRIKDLYLHDIDGFLYIDVQN